MPEPYKGIREVSEYMRAKNVLREYRVAGLQSFMPETVRLRVADEATYGLIHGGSRLYGQWLMPTLPGEHFSLSLPPQNTTEHLTHFYLKPGTVCLEGEVAPPLGEPGGGNQIYVTEPSETVLEHRYKIGVNRERS